MNKLIVICSAILVATVAKAGYLSWSCTEGLTGMDGTAAYLFV